jgi:uncharacterized protein
MMLFVFRKLSPRALIIAAGVCVLLMTARENRNLYERKAMIRQGESIASIDTTVTKLTFQQKAALDEMLEFKAHNEPEAKLKSAKESIDQMTTSYASVYEARTGDYTGTLVKYIYFSLWDVLIFMMLGMAFFKLGILTGSAPTRVYIWMCIIGLSVGLMLSWVMIQYVMENNFNGYNVSKNLPFSFSELSRTPRAIGIFGLIMVLYKSNVFARFFLIMRAVGQMAFTNYLMQSVICGVLFNAYGFKLYGQLQRFEIYLVVLCIWVFQIMLSNIWMRYFLFGPFEWAWRSLTYWKKQRFLRTLNPGADVHAIAESKTTQIG